MIHFMRNIVTQNLVVTLTNILISDLKYTISYDMNHNNTKSLQLSGYVKDMKIAV